MDRIDELAVLLAIIDAGSLTAAAKRLNRSPPAITRILASLEARTGDKLLTRNSHGVVPTPRGSALAEDARRLLDLYEDATQTSPRDRRAIRLRLTAPVLFGRRHVAPIIGRLMDEEPQLHCELLLQDRVLDLHDEGIDIAIRIGGMADPDLVSIVVGSLRSRTVGAPAYLERFGEPESPRDLPQHALLLGLRGGYPSEWRFSEEGRRAMPRLHGRLALDDIETRLEYVLEGRGLSQFLSYQVYHELREGRLTRLLAPFEPDPITVSLVQRGIKRHQPAFQHVVDRLVDALSSNPMLREEDTGSARASH